jgi:hypothetical protein
MEKPPIQDYVPHERWHAKQPIGQRRPHALRQEARQETRERLHSEALRDEASVLVEPATRIQPVRVEDD